MSARAAWRLETLGFDPVYDYTSGKQDWLAAGLPPEGREAHLPRAGTVCRKDVPTCGLGDSMAEVSKRVRTAGWDVCLVVNEERVVFGILRDDAFDEQGERTAEKAMRPGPSTFRPNVPIEEMAHLMTGHGIQNATVTTSDGRLVGLLVLEDAVRAAHALHESARSRHE
ncbi:MAG: CBS domain-containing protein [Actinomycetota bacterium]